MRNYVLIITLHADPSMAPGYEEWGGTHTYMRELLDEFEKKQLHCILVTRKSMRYLPTIENYNDCCTIYRLFNESPEPMSKLRLKEFHDVNVSKVRDIIMQQEEPPSVIHSIYWNSGRVAIELSKTFNIPFVHSIISNSRGRVKRGAFEPLPEREHYEQLIYDSAEKLICVSDDEKNDLVNLYNVPINKIVVAGQYIHPAFLLPAHDRNGFPRINSAIGFQNQKNIADTYNTFSPNNIVDDYWVQRTFTYLGRMDINKGIDIILKAWYQLYKKYKEFCPPIWLVGGSLSEIEKMRIEVKKTISSIYTLEKKGKIVWWGYLDPEGLSTVLLKTSVLITHSLYEPGGRVCIEAMSEGVPVIATPNGFAKDIIQDWREGFLVNYGDYYTLSLRMEHFIRQPYLSNSLGLNAKEKAIEVIRQWDFTEKHLSCYNITKSTAVELQINAGIKGFIRGRIDLFPYRNIPYSQELISRFCIKHTQQQIISIQRQQDGICTSEIYKIVGSNEEYIVKRILSRLSMNPLFNPIGKDEYVRNAERFYHIELTAYSRMSSDILVGYDDFHYLLLMKNLPVYEVNQKESLLLQIYFLQHRENCLSELEINYYIQILKKPKETLLQIDEVIQELNQKIPSFYFDPSGMFSNELCWKIASHLLEYNQSHFTDEVYEKLTSYIKFYNHNTTLTERHQIRSINIDTKLEHIRNYDGNLCMIDFEKNSIGAIETEIAGLLVDYIIQNQCNDKTFWLWAIENINSMDRINLREILINASYRFFYEYIEQIVLHHSHSKFYMNQMEYLYQILKEMNI